MSADKRQQASRSSSLGRHSLVGIEEDVIRNFDSRLGLRPDLRAAITKAETLSKHISIR